MITEKNFKDFFIITLIVFLLILTAMILKPIALAIVTGLLLAYIFFPVYRFFVRHLKSENISAGLICILLILIVLIPLILIISYLTDQAITFYLILQKTDFSAIFIKIFPSLVNSSELSGSIISSLNSFVPKMISYFILQVSNFIINIPTFILKLFIAFFVLFFSLRDGEKGLDYIKSLSIIEKEHQEKFFKHFKDITNSVLMGQVLVGLIQGFIAGIGYFVLGVPYAIILTIITMLTSIIPLLGAWIIWVPVDLYLFVTGKTGAAIGLLVYGLLVISIIDNVLRTIIISRKTQINSAIVIVGMIGGLFVFGVLGFILGPLILGYVLLVLEIYRKKALSESIFFKEGVSKES